MPGVELTDVDTLLDDVWSRRAVARLRQRLLEASTLESMLDALELALCETLRPGRRHPAVAFALDRFSAPDGMARVSDVTDVIALSPKRFIEPGRTA